MDLELAEFPRDLEPKIPEKWLRIHKGVRLQERLGYAMNFREEPYHRPACEHADYIKSPSNTTMRFLADMTSDTYDVLLLVTYIIPCACGPLILGSVCQLLTRSRFVARVGDGRTWHMDIIQHPQSVDQSEPQLTEISTTTHSLS